MVRPPQETFERCRRPSRKNAVLRAFSATNFAWLRKRHGGHFLNPFPEPPFPKSSKLSTRQAGTDSSQKTLCLVTACERRENILNYFIFFSLKAQARTRLYGQSQGQYVELPVLFVPCSLSSGRFEVASVLLATIVCSSQPPTRQRKLENSESQIGSFIFREPNCLFHMCGDFQVGLTCKNIYGW